MLHITKNYALQTLCGEPHKICCESGKLDGLPLAKRFAEQFRQPEIFMHVDDKIVAAPMPEEQTQGGMSY